MEKLPVEYPPGFKPAHLNKRRSSESSRTMPFNYRRYSQQLVENHVPTEAIDIYVPPHPKIPTPSTTRRRRRSIDAESADDVTAPAQPPPHGAARMGRRQSAYARLQRDFGFSWDSPASIRPEPQQQQHHGKHTFDFGADIDESEETDDTAAASARACSSPVSTDAISETSCWSSRRFSIEDSGYLSPDYADLKIEYIKERRMKEVKPREDRAESDDYYLTGWQRLRLLERQKPELDVKAVDPDEFDYSSTDGDMPQSQTSSLYVSIDNLRKQDATVTSSDSGESSHRVRLIVITGEEAEQLRRAARLRQIEDYANATGEETLWAAIEDCANHDVTGMKLGDVGLTNRLSRSDGSFSSLDSGWLSRQEQNHSN